MKREDEIRGGLRLLPSRPVYLGSMAHCGKKNRITIEMFAFFSVTPSLVGIGTLPRRHSALYEGFGWALLKTMASG